MQRYAVAPKRKRYYHFFFIFLLLWINIHRTNWLLPAYVTRKKLKSQSRIPRHTTYKQTDEHLYSPTERTRCVLHVFHHVFLFLRDTFPLYLRCLLSVTRRLSPPLNTERLHYIPREWKENSSEAKANARILLTRSNSTTRSSSAEWKIMHIYQRNETCAFP